MSKDITKLRCMLPSVRPNRWCARVIILLVAVVVTAAVAPSDVRADQPDDDKFSWWDESKFGLFVHFGLYSIPGGVWDGEVVGRNWYAEWIRMQAGWPDDHGLTKEEYDSLLKEFNPTMFDADSWARLARDAGMKYLLITAKHHDGFALWDTQVSEYNSVDATPFGRDLLAELAEACEKHGLTLGFYYSHWQDWGHPGGAMPSWPEVAMDPVYKQPTQEEYEEYWQELVLPQVVELVRNYSPRFFWFDNWSPSPFLTQERLDQLIETVRVECPDCLINSRIGTTWNHPDGDSLVDYISMQDNEHPEEYIAGRWETSGTINNSWGYNKTDHAWKTVDTLIENLINNVSRGGNYQLNVGPMGNGEIEQAAVRRLLEVGTWMSSNGESIYGTSPVRLMSTDGLRWTARRDGSGAVYLYAHLLEWPTDSFLKIPDLTVNPRSVEILETGQELEFDSDPQDGVTLRLPGSPPDSRVSVLKLSFDAENKKSNALVIQ